LKMAIEIVSFPFSHSKWWFFHSFLYVYQRVHNFTHSYWATTQLSSKANSLATFHG
jgi:hypothetical protein